MRAEPHGDDDRVRMRQNLAAMIVIVCIVVLGTWLIESLRTYSRIQTCIEAGHRNACRWTKNTSHRLTDGPYCGWLGLAAGALVASCASSWA